MFTILRLAPYPRAARDFRIPLHKSVVASLKRGGVFILEAFGKDQLRYGTGGPPTEEMLMSLDELKQELKGFDNGTPLEMYSTLNLEGRA